MKGEIFGDMKKNCEKKSQSRKNMHKKFWSRARLEPTSFCLADLKKSQLTSMPSARSCDLHGHKFRLCDLRSETRELSRGKKHPHFPITLAYRKCNNIFSWLIFEDNVRSGRYAASIIPVRYPAGRKFSSPTKLY